MITAREIVCGLYGAFRLACFDRRGTDFFDKTEEGFWRSFYAAALVLPLFVIFIALRFGEPGLTQNAFRYVSGELIAYVISWVAFPLAILPVTRILNREQNFQNFIVAYNWTAALQSMVYLPVAMLATTQVIPDGYANLISSITIGFILVYSWFVVRVVLDTTVMSAVAIVIMDLILSVLIRTYAEGLLRAV